MKNQNEFSTNWHNLRKMIKLCHMHIVHTDPNWFERWQLTEMYAVEFEKKQTGKICNSWTKLGNREHNWYNSSIFPLFNGEKCMRREFKCEWKRTECIVGTFGRSIWIFYRVIHILSIFLSLCRVFCGFVCLSIVCILLCSQLDSRTASEICFAEQPAIVNTSTSPT